MLDEYWDEKDKPYSDDFDFRPDWLYQYLNKLPLGEAIGIAYLTWKSEQNRLTPKYNILCSLAPLLKRYFVTMKEDDNQFKITCQRCNVFLICKGRSGELLYITFLHAVLSTLGLYTEELHRGIFYFHWPARTKIQHMYHKFLKATRTVTMS